MTLSSKSSYILKHTGRRLTKMPGHSSNLCIPNTVRSSTLLTNILSWIHCLARFSKNHLGLKGLCGQITTLPAHLQIAWPVLNPNSALMSEQTFRISPKEHSVKCLLLAQVLYSSKLIYLKQNFESFVGSGTF